VDALLPVALVAGAGLVAWGELRAKVNGLRSDVDDKASKEIVVSIDERLDRIEMKLDRLVEQP
jgi:hypothetical protein